MHAHEFNDFHRARLRAETERAREALEASTRHARESMAGAPLSDPDDAEAKLYHKGGDAAFYFCLWFAFLAPVILFVTHWD